MHWFDDPDQAQQAIERSQKLVIAVLSSSSVSHSIDQDRGRLLVEELIRGRPGLPTMVSEQCILLSQRCGKPDELCGTEPPSHVRIIVGILDEELRCQRLTIGLPTAEWLLDALNDTVLQQLMLMGEKRVERRREIVVDAAVDRLDPIWRAHVGNSAGSLTVSGTGEQAAAAWRLQASFHMKNMNSLLISDLSTRLGLRSNSADPLRLRSLAQHAETCMPMADAMLAIAPGAPWPDLSRVIAETSWQTGYWLPPNPDDPFVQQLTRKVAAGQPVVLQLRDDRIDSQLGTMALGVNKIDDAGARKLNESIEQYDRESIDLHQLASIAVAHDWPSTDYFQPVPARFIVFTSPDEPPTVMRWNENENRIRRKLDSLYRTAQRRSSP